MATISEQRRRQAGAPPATLSLDQGEAILTLGDLPLLVESFQAVRVPKPGGKEDETVPAYDVVLKAVLPEALAAVLLAKVRNHKVVVIVREPDDGMVTE